MNRENLRNFVAAALSAASGRYVSAGINLAKNWKIIVGAVAALMFTVIVIVSVIVSIPGIMMQSLLPASNEKEINLSAFASQEINTADAEKNSFIANLLSSLSKDKEKKAVLEGKAPSKEEILIIYMVKYGEYFDQKSLDKAKVREITRSFFTIEGLTVKVLPFDTVINKNNLSDQQKSIALNMYKSYMFDQTTGFIATDVIKSLGNVTYTNGETDVIYYSQRDERWAFEKYGDGTVGRSACGPTCLAMVISSFTNQKLDPEEMANWAYKHGYKSEGGGSYWSLIPAGARNAGLKVSGNVTEGQQLVDALADGKLIIAIMGKGHFTSSGHFIVLRGVTSDGKIMVADPYSTRNTEKLWDLSVIWSEVKNGTTADGPFWIISK